MIRFSGYFNNLNIIDGSFLTYPGHSFKILNFFNKCGLRWLHLNSGYT